MPEASVTEQGVRSDNGLFPAHAGHPFLRFSSRRSPVHSTKGIVSCTQPLAAAAGIKVLELGGNAADAAVAAAAALNVTEPMSTGIGGDMFCLYYDAKAKKTRALNGSGRSPSKLSLAALRQQVGLEEGEEGVIPDHGPLAVSTPAAAAGWVDTVEKFGSGRVTLQQVLQPAIDLAEQGFPVHQLSAKLWTDFQGPLLATSEHGRDMLKRDDLAPGGFRAPAPGELFRNQHLANTFRALAEQGKRGFYEGPIAQSIVQAVQDLGGHLSLDDLRSHADTGSQEVEPVSVAFAGQGLAEPIELWEHPPNGQGLVALIALRFLEELEKAGKIPAFRQHDHNSVEYLHALIEALRVGFAEASWHVADHEHYTVPIDELLHLDHIKKRVDAFDPAQAAPLVNTSAAAFSKSDTVYLAVTDPEGNAASFINSNYYSFGSFIVPEKAGFVLQNRGANFALQPPHHPNVYAPGKRPYHTIIPAMVTNANDGSLHTCFGVMGGFMQPQGHVQVLLNMLVFGMNPQEALDAPRICLESIGTSGSSTAGQDLISLEEGIAPDAVGGLEKLGHKVRVLDGYARFAKFGRGQVIRRTVDDGQVVWSAGSDLRGDGHAAPL